jgi:hypothetical protein
VIGCPVTELITAGFGASEAVVAEALTDSACAPAVKLRAIRLHIHAFTSQRRSFIEKSLINLTSEGELQLLSLVVLQLIRFHASKTTIFGIFNADCAH